MVSRSIIINPLSTSFKLNHLDVPSGVEKGGIRRSTSTAIQIRSS